MNILVIDNYDSFTYNLVQYIKEIVPLPLDVYRNDQIPLGDVELYDIIVLSPGPGIPAESGITPEVITRYGSSKCILGVCLGHQAIGEAYGGKLHNLEKVFHGVATEISISDHNILFKDLPDSLEVGRYHSWVVVEEQFPQDLLVTSTDEKGTIMSLRHKDHNVFGVQFHPESILTPEGKKILRNFFNHAIRETEKKQSMKENKNLV
jgi:anthranilate synthase component 2